MLKKTQIQRVIGRFFTTYQHWIYIRFLRFGFRTCPLEHQQVTNDAVEQVAIKEKHQAVPSIKEEQGGYSEYQDEAANANFGGPVDLLETRIANGADHQVGDEEHEERQEEGPILQAMLVNHQYDCRDHASRCGNWR